jgi:photosystem II stability/assembly factor-like uncharacterized protein
MRLRGTFLILLILLYLILACQSFAGINFQEKFQISYRDKIFALHFNDEKRGWAVGDMGLILHTEDGGETWAKLAPIPDNSLNDVVFIDQNGWVVGEGGTILHTQDGGKNWKTQDSKSDASLFSVSFRDKQSGVIVGERGTVLLTEDGGSSWQPSSLDWTKIIPESLIAKGIFALNLYDVFFTDENHGWMVGDAGAVLFTSDGGKTFALLRIGTYPPLYSVFFKTDLEGWATGASGNLLYTQDGGKNWKELNLPTKANLFKIRMSGDEGVIVGDLGTVLQTDNGGKNWDLVKLDLRLPLPWLLDAALILHNSPGEIIFGGQGIIKRYPLKNREEKP